MKKRILVVDDDYDLVDSIRIYLEDAGYDVVAAYDGKEALKVAREKTPDLAILDVNLPELDGFRVAQTLQHDEDTVSIRIVFLTIRDSEFDEYVGRSSGGVAYVRKPFRWEELMREIHIGLAQA